MKLRRLASGLWLVSLAAACGGVSDDSAPEPGGAAGALGGGGSSGFAGGVVDAGWAAAGGWSGASGSSAVAGGAGTAASAGVAAVDASSPDASPPPDLCAGKSDGKYCGAVLGGGKAKLFTCDAGVTSNTKTCENGCFNGTYRDKCKANCCLGKPPGYIPVNGGWNDCPYSGSGRQHMAIDYTSAKNTPIPAGMDAVVQFIRAKGDPNCYTSGGCSLACKASGDYIVLRAACGDPKKPGNDFFVRYHHINKVKKGIKVGDKVARGDTIAFVGDSGCATGPHIHLMTATFKKGKYKTGTSPNFFSCGTTVNPATRRCK